MSQRFEGNRQPWSCGADMLFTTTKPITEVQFVKAFRKFAASKAAEHLKILPDTVECQSWLEPEAGDPADLLR